MQTFKTYEELMTQYWGKIVPMAQAAGIKPWECVRHVNEDKFTDHPHFKGKQWHYTFAITILEGKPVFVGDKLYYKDTEFIVADCSEKQSFSNVTWTPPAKKRTFMLGDKELPCPDKNKGGYQISLISSRHFFSDFHDAQKVANAIDAILTEARDS